MANLDKSEPIQHLPSFSATAKVVSAPQKKSATMSPGLGEARIMRWSNSSGFCVSKPTRSSATGFIIDIIAGLPRHRSAVKRRLRLTAIGDQEVVAVYRSIYWVRPAATGRDPGIGRQRWCHWRDNFRSHHAIETREFARKEHIELVYLPPYSPDLNPIEYIWKRIKRIVSATFVKDLYRVICIQPMQSTI